MTNRAHAFALDAELLNYCDGEYMTRQEIKRLQDELYKEKMEYERINRTYTSEERYEMICEYF